MSENNTSIPSPKAEPFKLWLAQVGMYESAKVAKEGGSVAKDARESYEKRSGKKIVTSLNAKDLKALKGKEDVDDS